MTHTDIDHVLLTRFNLPSVGAESVIRARDGWLTSRVELFDRYCVPSVLAQTEHNFSWIIYFDPESPSWLVDRIERYAAHGVFFPLFRASVSHDELLADIDATIGVKHSTLITTNLDNDDGLARDFVERLQAVTTQHDRAAVYIENGLIASPAGLYRRRDRHNAFCSVRETWVSPSTCWSDWHNLLGTSMPVIEVGGQPGWLQVVHGTNVSNRARGTLVSPTAYAERFPTLPMDAPVPRAVDLMLDRLVFGPTRMAKETARALAKWLAMTLVGKKGLDRIKLGLIGAPK